jgi:hypothetical protein
MLAVNVPPSEEMGAGETGTAVLIGFLANRETSAADAAHHHIRSTSAKSLLLSQSAQSARFRNVDASGLATISRHV